ncbi:hypothetical protein ABK040_011658 [Willaertia magna]
MFPTSAVQSIASHNNHKHQQLSSIEEGNTLVAEEEQEILTCGINYLSSTSIHGKNKFSLLKNTNELYGTGENKFGQLGYSSLTKKVFHFTKIPFDVPNRKIIKIASGENFSFLLTDYQELYATGVNNYGQLGFGDKDGRLKFTLVPIQELMKSKSSTIIESISCGFSHSFLLTLNGNLYCCGENFCGQLGLLNSQDVLSFQKIELPFKVKQIVCVLKSSLILNEKSELFVCGDNSCNQIGIPSQSKVFGFTKINNLPPIKRISEGFGVYTILISKYNEIYGSGDNSYCQLGFEGSCQEIETYKIINEVQKNYNYISKGNIFVTCGSFFTVILMSKFNLYENSNDTVFVTLLFDCYNNLYFTDVKIIAE